MIESLFSSQNYVASKHLLDATALRQQALASNIANVETPGYKRVDLPREFATEFAAKLRAGTLRGAPAPAIVEDKFAVSQRKDGNNVALDAELLALTRNSIEFDTLSELVSGSLKQLRLAITGRSI